jgi:hypothetical protein
MCELFIDISIEEAKDIRTSEIRTFAHYLLNKAVLILP